MHKEVSNNQKMWTKVQQVPNTKASVLPFNFHIGGYVLVRPAFSHDQTLYTGWIEPMRIIEAKSDLVFVVDDLQKSRPFNLRAHHLIHYPTQHLEQPVRKELLEQAEYLDSSMQFVDTLHDLRMRNGEYKIFVSWLGWNNPDDPTCEPFANLKEDVPQFVKDFLHSTGKISVKKKILNLYYKGYNFNVKYIMGHCDPKFCISICTWYRPRNGFILFSIIGTFWTVYLIKCLLHCNTQVIRYLHTEPSRAIYPGSTSCTVNVVFYLLMSQ